MNAVTTSGLQEAREEQGKANGRTGKCAGREGETWRSHWPSHLSMASCFTLPSSVGWMPRGSVNSRPKQGWTSTLTSTSYSFFDGAPAHRRPNQLGPNTELKMLPSYSPFLNIVEQAISALKAAIKADISRPEVQERMNNSNEARDRGVTLGVYRTQLLLEARHHNNCW